MYSLEQSKEFELLANPHSWFLVASELHDQAKLLFESNGSIITHFDSAKSNPNSWNASNRTIILLAGFALENVIKGYLVYEYPEYVRNGFLSKKIQSHKISRIAQGSSFLPYKSRSLNTLKYFEDGLESWARYPCGLNWAQTKEQSYLTSKVWKNYLWLMRSYEIRFKALMKKGWQGTHGFKGKFDISGTWFE